MIDEVDFHELEAQRYWSFPKSYKKDIKEEIRNMIYSGDYIGSRKIDGAFYKFIKDENGTVELLGRSRSVSGEFLNKIDWVPQLKPFFDSLPNGTCLLGELYFPGNEGSNKVTTITGCLVDKAIKRQEKNKLHYYIFDCLAFNNKSLLNKKCETRFKLIDILCRENKSQYVDFAKYFTGAELWVELQTILSQGGEGVVITKLGTTYQPGKRPARQTIKIKKELTDTIDAFFTGSFMPATVEYKGKEIQTWQYWENTQTGEKFLDNNHNTFLEYERGAMIQPITKGHFYGWAGSLEVGVFKNGEVYPIGWLSGLPDEIKANVSKYAMKPFEMTAMQIYKDTNGKGLRHAKFLRWRPDQDLENCTYEKIFGE